MEQLGRLMARINSIDELLSVVGAMRSLAAIRRQQATKALIGTRGYAEAVAGGLACALPLVFAEDTENKRTSGGRALLVFGSEHGFVGAFNEVLLARTQKETAVCDLLIIGSRCTALAREKKFPVTGTLTMATHRDAVPTLARILAATLFPRFGRGELTRVDMVFARNEGGRWAVVVEPLLPLDLHLFAKADGVEPIHNLPPRRLIETLVGEYFCAALALGAMESLVAENTARFLAMEAARDNIERKLDDLRGVERQLRQEDITTELLDVVTGAQALQLPTPAINARMTSSDSRARRSSSVGRRGLSRSALTIHRKPRG